MPRHPLLPLLRVGPVLLLGTVLLYAPKRKPPPPFRPPDPGIWATDTAPEAPGWLQVGLKAAGPLPGQKRPPCTPVREREAVGGCWIGTEHRPPCPEGIYEVQARCVVPVQASARQPTSVQE